MSGYGGASLGAAESRRRRGSAQRRVGADPVPAAPSRMTTMAPGGAAIPSSPSLPPLLTAAAAGAALPPPAAPPHADLAPRVAGATDPMPATTVGSEGDGSGSGDDGRRREQRIRWQRRRRAAGAMNPALATGAGAGGGASGWRAWAAVLPHAARFSFFLEFYFFRDFFFLHAVGLSVRIQKSRMRLRWPHAKIMIFAVLFMHAASPTACENACCPYANTGFVVVFLGGKVYLICT